MLQLKQINESKPTYYNTTKNPSNIIKMGIQQSQPSSCQSPTPSQSNYYGGQLLHNAQTHTTYQKFTIQQKSYDKFLSLIRSRQKLQHGNFITVKNHWKRDCEEKKFSCTDDKRIEVFVEYQALSESLSKRLDRMSESGRVVPEVELVGIGRAVVSCLIYLKTKGTCHGDIKPESIYFDSLGKVKLLDSFFMNGGRTAYEIVMENPSSMSLLSPEQLTRLRDKQFDDISLIYENEMFSLGLTMYECMTFEPAMECYDLEKLKIKKDFFKGKEQVMFGNGYSPQLVEIVMSLILKPAQSRLSSHQLSDIFAQFSY